jgi:hypothetical protein
LIDVLRWIAGAHFGKDLFGGNATIHQPDPIGLAVLVLDFFNKALSVVLSAVLPLSTS